METISPFISITIYKSHLNNKSNYFWVYCNLSADKSSVFFKRSAIHLGSVKLKLKTKTEKQKTKNKTKQNKVITRVKIAKKIG